LLEVIMALLAGRKPNIPAHSVCFECKVTHAGCSALFIELSQVTTGPPPALGPRDIAGELMGTGSAGPAGGLGFPDVPRLPPSAAAPA
jgi:hypothetical protein